MRRRTNVGSLLEQHHRRWANSKPTLGRRLMFAGLKLRQDKSIGISKNLGGVFGSI